MHVLLVDDDPAIREALGQTLELEGLVACFGGSFCGGEGSFNA